MVIDCHLGWPRRISSAFLSSLIVAVCSAVLMSTPPTLLTLQSLSAMIFLICWWSLLLMASRISLYLFFGPAKQSGHFETLYLAEGYPHFNWLLSTTYLHTPEQLVPHHMNNACTRFTVLLENGQALNGDLCYPPCHISLFGRGSGSECDHRPCYCISKERVNFP